MAPASLFATLQPRRNHQAILYQMGNSRYHRFLYPYLLQHPGITTLHDLSLADFQLDRLRSSTDFRASIHEALVGDGATVDEADDLTRDLLYGTEGATGFISSCLKRGYALNSALVDASLGIIVHSTWSANRLKQLRPEAADRIHVLPIGSEAHPTSPQERTAAKVRAGLPAGSLICGCFGFLDPSKQNFEAIQAFASLAHSRPDALLLFIGQELDDGLARREAERLELGSRVRFLGRQPDHAYRDLLAAIDIGIILRRPPTKGETSAALVQLLGHGVPTIVSRVDTFGDVDPKVVHFVKPGPNLIVDLAQALQELAESPDRRAVLSRAGAHLVRIQHDWKLVASTYRAHIDRIIDMNRLRTHRPTVHGAAG